MHKFAFLLFLWVGAANGQSPDPPRQVLASATSTGILVEWLPSASMQVADYRIERRLANEASGYLIATVPLAQLSFHDSTATAGRAYSYRVQARSIFAVDGAFSGAVEARFLDQVPPAEPDGLTATVGELGVFLNWVPPTDPDVSGFSVYRAPGAGPSGRIATTENSQFLDTLAVVSQPYSYSVTALDYSGNEGVRSAEVAAIRLDEVAPGRVSVLEAVDTPGGIQLSWLAPAARDVETFRVLRGTNPREAQLLAELPSDVLTYLDTGSRERIFYIYRVSAVDSSGNEGEPEFVQILHQDLTPPLTPSGLSAVRSDNAIRLSWDPPVDRDLVAFYLVSRSILDGRLDSLRVDPAATVALVVPFGAGLPRAYHVFAVDSSGNESPGSAEILTALVPATFLRQSFAQELGSQNESGRTYQLISIPGRQQLDLIPTFSGPRGEDWDVLDPYSGLPRQSATLQPGEVVWAFSASEWSLAAERVDQVIPDGLEFVYTIPLRDGWNVISNPFEIVLDWNRVMNWNQTTGSLFGFDAGFFLTTRFAPYSGYFYLNSDGLASLELPFIPQAFVSGPSTSAGWTITAESDGARASVDLMVGSEGATLDDALPPNHFGAPRLSLLRPDGAEMRSLMIGQPTQAADFTLLLDNFEPPAVITALNSGTDDHLFLVDEAGNRHLLGARSVSILAGHSPVRLGLELRLQPGPGQGSGPSRLVSVYPNPVSGVAVLVASLENSGVLSVDLFDLLGRRVTTIASLLLDSGTHNVIWEPAGNIPSGTYLLRATSGPSTSTMVIQLVR